MDKKVVLAGGPDDREIIEKLANINGLNWIRLHYAYPNTFSLDLLDLMNLNLDVQA